MAQVKLIKWQLDVASDPHRFKIICAGRRAGKSVLSRLIVLKWAVEQPGLYWVVSPSYKMSKMIHWQALQKEVPRSWVAKKNEVELSITLKNGSVIELKGAENPDALRGVKLRGLVIDEIASIRNWDWLWEEVLRPTLTDFQAPALFISTPKGFNHFYDLYVSGQGGKTDYKSWRFTSYDNPHISKEELDAAKKELTEDTFAQEYMADFRKYTGLVYKEFDRDIHVVEPFDVPITWPLYRAIDFGSTNPTACLWITVDDDDNFFVFAEHYQTGETIDYHAGVINAKVRRSVVATYGDPSGAQWISEFAQKGIYITPANKESSQSPEGWVRVGIEKVAERLRSLPGHFVPRIRTNHSNPKLFIFSSCINLIKEFETYRWQEKSVSQARDMNEPDKPEKANDHAMDALRYFTVSYRKQVNTTPLVNNFSAYTLE
jgi:hypothetical protein